MLVHLCGPTCPKLTLQLTAQMCSAVLGKAAIIYLTPLVHRCCSFTPTFTTEVLVIASVQTVSETSLHLYAYKETAASCIMLIEDTGLCTCNISDSYDYKVPHHESLAQSCSQWLT